MIYTNYDYLDKYQSVISYLIQNATEAGYAFPYIEKQIAYSKLIEEFENSNVTTIAFSSLESIYSTLFENNPFSDVSDYSNFGWLGFVYIDLFLKKKITFEALFLILPIEELLKKYPLYHEMDIAQLEDEIDELTKYSLLDVIMKAKEVTTSILAEKTSIPYSTLSAIRFGKRDIDKVEFKTVNKIAKALNIKIESLSHLELTLD